MAQNIEIKAICKNLDKAREIALQQGVRRVGMDHQVDTYFTTKQGRFKLRESSLSGAYLVPYLRPDQTGAKKSEYATIPTTDSVTVKKLFSEILGQEVVVDKQREIFLIDNVRVHLDEVKGLGTFFELEALYEDDTPESREREQQKVQELLQLFGVGQSDFLHGSYREMVVQ